MDVFDYFAICNDRDFYDIKFMMEKYQGQFMDAFFIYQSNCVNIGLKDQCRNTIIYNNYNTKDIDFECILKGKNGDLFEEIYYSLLLEGINIPIKEISEIYLSGDNNQTCISAYKYMKENVINRSTVKGLTNILGLNCDVLGFTEFVEYILSKGDQSILQKSLVLNYYGTYITKNSLFGRIIHLWFLLENDYRIKETVNLSNILYSNKKKYEILLSKIIENKKIVSYIDITPYLSFIINQINSQKNNEKSCPLNGDVTKKEEELYNFSREYFKDESFSSKDLEKAYSNSSYETIRKFLIKFTELEYLKKIDYSSRPRYVVL